MNNISSFVTESFELIVVTLFIFLLLITVLFMKNLEKKVSLKSSELENPEKYLKLLSTIRDLIETTRKDSHEMLSRANEESAAILKENLNFSENMQDLIKKKSEIVKKNYLQELKRSSQKLSLQFQEEYKKEFTKSLADLKESNSAINKKILEEAENLIQDIHSHLNSNHDLIIKKIDEDMVKTDEFLSTYRKAKIEEFDREFDNMTSFYIKDYLKKTLSFDEHEEIIRNIMKDFEKSLK
jgi:DNA anti-recombination protein RmuC